MEFIGAIGSIAMSCLAQACCWYTVFRQCGCIEAEREVIHTAPPPKVITPKKSDNPFLHQQPYSHYPT